MVTTFFASSSFFLKPSDIRVILQIALKSGTIIATGLNKLAKLSGSSDLPAYPGFIVIKRPVSLATGKVLSLIVHYSASPFLIQSKITYIWEAITESTSSKILLNSSKHPQEPDHAKPANILPMSL